MGESVIKHPILNIQTRNVMGLFLKNTRTFHRGTKIVVHALIKTILE